MAIRIRTVKGVVVAVCAAKVPWQRGDMYLDDAVHHALMVKFAVDLKAEGLLQNPPVDEIVKQIMLEHEECETS